MTDVILFSKSDLEQVIKSAVAEAMSSYVATPTMEGPKDEYLSRNEVAAKLKVSMCTLWRMSRENRLIPRRVGRKLLYLRDDVEKVIK